MYTQDLLEPTDLTKLRFTRPRLLAKTENKVDQLQSSPPINNPQPTVYFSHCLLMPKIYLTY